MALQDAASCFWYSGGHNDFDAEFISSLNTGATGKARSTTAPQTGAGSIALDMSVNANDAWVRCGSRPDLAAAYWAYAGVSAAPSAEQGIFSQAASSTIRHLRIGTDRLLYVYDNAGTRWGPSSKTAIPTSGGAETLFVTCPWPLRVGANATAVWVGVNNVWEMAFVIPSVSPFGSGAVNFGEDLGATNYGNILYGDDVGGAQLGDLGRTDAPTLIQYPRLRVAEAVNPDDNGNYQEWINESAGTATFASVDNSELPTHDGDGSIWQSTTINTRQLVKSGDTNPVPNSTIHKVQQRWVSKLTGGGKSESRHFCRMGGTDQTTASEQTGETDAAYLGQAVRNLARPGGGSWVYTDFAADNFEWGLVTQAADAGTRCTLMLGPDVVYYENSWPLAPNPDPMMLFHRKSFVMPGLPSSGVRPPQTFMGLFTQAAPPVVTRRRQGWII